MLLACFDLSLRLSSVTFPLIHTINLHEKSCTSHFSWYNFYPTTFFHKCTMNKQTFPWHESLVWSIALSQHACFGGLNYYFRVLLPLFTTSVSHVVLLQWNPTLLLYAQECFSPGEGRACSLFLFLFLPGLYVPNFSLWMRSNTCHMSNKKWVKSFPGNECKIALLSTAVLWVMS